MTASRTDGRGGYGFSFEDSLYGMTSDEAADFPGLYGGSDCRAERRDTADRAASPEE